MSRKQQTIMAAIMAMTSKFAMDRLPRMKRKARKPHRDNQSRITLGAMIRICPGKRQAWFESNVGPVRKPLAGVGA